MFTTADHDTERELTAGTDHGHGCWEIFSEKSAERGESDGKWSDEVDGVTLWVKYLDYIAAGGCEGAADCPAEDDEDE